MAITYQTNATVNNPGPGSTSKTCNAPSGVVANDLLIGFVEVGSVTASITPPSGWTQRSSLQDRFDTSAVFSLVAGGSEPSSYTWTLAAAAYTDIAILRYNGGDATTPYDTSSTKTNTSTTTPTTNSIVTARNGNLVTTFFADLNSAIGTTTPPTGMTERVKWDNAQVVNDVVQASAGATGVETETTTGASYYIASIESFNAPAVSATEHNPIPIMRV